MSQNKRNNYLIVDKRILPDYYEKVLAAQEMLRTGRCQRSQRGGPPGRHIQKYLL